MAKFNEILSKVVRAQNPDLNPTDDIKALNRMSGLCHTLNEKWWIDPKDGSYIENRNVPELLCLVHSEVSEAMEAYRKNAMDDKLPDRFGIEVELADVLIRVFDIAGAMDLDLGGAVADKIAFNLNRPDHSLEARAAEGGKRF